MSFPEPSSANGFLTEHIQRLVRSYRCWTGAELVDPTLDPIAAARWLYYAPFALLSHDAQEDPVFNYANLTAQRLFERDWENFTGLPSRLSAEPPVQAERRRLLEEVTAKGYIADYCGIRIAKSGRRFRIEGALVWNVYDETGAFCGQAARIDRWHWLADSE